MAFVIMPNNDLTETGFFVGMVSIIVNLLLNYLYLTVGHKRFSLAD